MSLSIVTTNVLVDPATYASRAGALRAAKREGLTEYKIEQVSSGRFLVMVPQANVAPTVFAEAKMAALFSTPMKFIEETADERADFNAKYAASRAQPAVEPEALKFKAALAPKAPKPVKAPTVTKQTILADLLRAEPTNVAALAAAMSVTETAVNSLFSDLRRKGTKIITTKVEGEKVRYSVAA